MSQKTLEASTETFVLSYFIFFSGGGEEDSVQWSSLEVIQAFMSMSEK